MDPGDVSSVVEVHLDAFAGFFLSFLGASFLRVYYERSLRQPSAVAFVAVDGVEVVGFVLGSTKPSGFYRELLRRGWWQFGLAALPGLIRRPKAVMRVLRALRKPAEVRHGADDGGLFSLAVRTDSQRGGVGRALMKEFLMECERRGVSRVFLETDAVDNSAVLRFYEGAGFARVREYEAFGERPMVEYAYTVRGPRDPECDPCDD